MAGLDPAHVTDARIAAEDSKAFDESGLRIDRVPREYNPNGRRSEATHVGRPGVSWRVIWSWKPRRTRGRHGESRRPSARGPIPELGRHDGPRGRSTGQAPGEGERSAATL